MFNRLFLPLTLCCSTKVILNLLFCRVSNSTKYRCTQGGGGGKGWGGRGAPHVPPIKIFVKLPHKNAMKPAPSPLVFSQPQVPPSKESAKKTQGPHPPPWISKYCASMLGNQTLFKFFCGIHFFKKAKCFTAVVLTKPLLFAKPLNQKTKSEIWHFLYPLELILYLQIKKQNIKIWHFVGPPELIE